MEDLMTKEKKIQMICKDCRYFFPVTVPQNTGVCKRKPPVPVHCTIKEQIDTVWPLLAEGDWCGEFKSKQA